MGQYHIVASFTAGEYLNATDFGQGVKLAEMYWSKGGLMQALGEKLQTTWKGHRVAVVGDYYHTSDFPKDTFTAYNEDFTKTNLFDYIEDNFMNGKTEHFINNNVEENYVIYNYSKNEMVTPQGFGDSTNPNIFCRDGYEGGVMSVLLVLLATSCKGGPRGGGDIDSDNEFVGSWGGDSIGIIPLSELPKNPTCIDEGMRKVMQEANETSYSKVNGVWGRTAWDFTKNRHGEMRAQAA